MTQYENLLRTIPCFHGLHRRELRIIARLVDVVDVPAGGQLSRAKGEVIVAVQGHTTTNPDGTMFAVTRLRLFVFGRRELLSLFEELPDRVLRIVLYDHTTASQSTPRARRLRSSAERTRFLPTALGAPIGSRVEPFVEKVGRRGA